MWILQLNNIQNSAESLTALACAETREQLEQFVTQETEPWTDDSNATPNLLHGFVPYTWNKTFR